MIFFIKEKIEILRGDKNLKKKMKYFLFIKEKIETLNFRYKKS